MGGSSHVAKTKSSCLLSWLFIPFQFLERSLFKVSVPSISVPKGGGAICGMGEKFAANPVDHTSGP